MIHTADIQVMTLAGYTREAAVSIAVRAENGDNAALDIILAAHALRLSVMQRMGKLVPERKFIKVIPRKPFVPTEFK